MQNSITTQIKNPAVPPLALVPKEIKELNVRIDNNKEGSVWFDDVKIVEGNTSRAIVFEESNYYPFGLKHKGYNNVTNTFGNAAAQKFGFTGKEHQDELGLGWIDITARNYDPALGRWMNVDPLAEKMRRHSPYNYAFNNPIFFIDPDGMEPCPNGDCTKTETVSNQTTHTFKYDDKGETTGTDTIVQTKNTIATTTDADGNVIQTIDTTTMSTTTVDADGNIGEVNTKSWSTVKTKESDGSWSTLTPKETAQYSSGGDISKADGTLREKATEVSSYKKKNNNISPIHQEARDNSKFNNTSSAIGGGMGALGRALAKYITHPATKTAGGIIAGAGAVVVTVPKLVKPTDPEKIVKRVQHN